MKRRITAKTLAYGAILIALNIVITRLISVNIHPVRIGFNFIPVALGAMMFGPVAGAVLAVIADVAGMLLSGGMPWLGFSISAALLGATYGLFLYNREISYKNLAVCVILQAIVIEILLGSVWYNHYMGTPFWGAVGARALNAVIMIPIKIIVIKYMYKLIGDRIKV